MQRHRSGSVEGSGPLSAFTESWFTGVRGARRGEDFQSRSETPGQAQLSAKPSSEPSALPSRRVKCRSEEPSLGTDAFPREQVFFPDSKAAIDNTNNNNNEERQSRKQHAGGRRRGGGGPGRRQADRERARGDAWWARGRAGTRAGAAGDSPGGQAAGVTGWALGRARSGGRAQEAGRQAGGEAPGNRERGREPAAEMAAEEAPENQVKMAEVKDEDEEVDEDKEIQEMQKKLLEMEAEAAKLNAEGEDDTNVGENGAAEPNADGAEGEGDEEGAANAEGTPNTGKSIFVGGLDASVTPDVLHEFFKTCGTINRITILCDKYTGRPKGHAYMEFEEEEAIEMAI
ncbi:Polyadenylate-binding protein 2 (PABP-2) (Poly(A)-binding protein 2) (Poly(A)-binding protein II) (PABII), partial [Durusdinium trenchii]